MVIVTSCFRVIWQLLSLFVMARIPDSKSGVRETASRVRIPLLPPLLQGFIRYWSAQKPLRKQLKN
jgi:hypothetical protein